MFTLVRLITLIVLIVLKMLTNLRVHIVPVGFHRQRVTEPLMRMQADKVYLVSFQPDDAVAVEYFSWVKDFLATNYRHIEVVEVYLDIWDLFECVEKYREIISEEDDNHVYINVSTGTKITAMAGMISCMIWGAQPYYSQVLYSGSGDDRTEEVGDPFILPVYGVNKPKIEFLLLLDVLNKSSGVLRKSELISRLEGLDIIKPRNGSELSSAAKHSQLRSLLDPMEAEWFFVRVVGSGRGARVEITEQGLNALRIFGKPHTDFVL